MNKQLNKQSMTIWKFSSTANQINFNIFWCWAFFFFCS
jgi:hypothetical protein